MGTTLEENKPPRVIQLANDCAAALQEMGLGGAELTAPQMIALARKQTGLDDFGDGDFFEALSRLLESCQRDAELNLIGRVALRADILHCLHHRLLLGHAPCRGSGRDDASLSRHRRVLADAAQAECRGEPAALRGDARGIEARCRCAEGHP